MSSVPFNQVAHEAIIAAGYDYLHVPANYWDAGDAENGPKVDGHPPFDQYSKVLGVDKKSGIQMVEFIYIDATDNGCEICPDYPEY